MPIKPENMSKYPGGGIRSPEWRSIRERIRLRAHDLCEGCGVVNGDIGFRLPDGTWLSAPGFTPGALYVFPYMRCEGGYCEFTGKAIRIVCTVAHVDDDLVDHSDENLRFWCQQCHNRNDANGRAARRKGKSRGD